MRSTDRVRAALLAAFLLSAFAHAAAAAENLPGVRLKGIPFRWIPEPETLAPLGSGPDSVAVSAGGEIVFEGTFDSLSAAGAPLMFGRAGLGEVVLSAKGGTARVGFRVIHGFLSILPPVVAIVFALVFRQVVIALLAGVWLGSLVVTGFDPAGSVMRIVDHYVIQTLAGREEGADHASILVFTLLLGGMVGITSRMGGMQGIVNSMSRLATNARRGQFMVWLMGVVIFFDDYTNTLIVGNSCRPMTDRLRISREKLSYIVDSTSAPVTSIAVITSWVGFQISLINQSFVSLGIDRNPLAALVSSIPYSFYPILAVLFVLFIVATGRDFSLMLKAERRARSTGKVNSDTAIPLSTLGQDSSMSIAEGASPRLLNGIIPIGTVIAVTFAGLLATGRASLVDSGRLSYGILDMLRESNSFTALLWSSFAGCIVASALALGQRLLNLTQTVEAWIGGIKSMVPAFVILVLAWCIGMVCVELHAAEFLVHHLASILSPAFLPMMVFLLATGISFATGTSWGTMSILTPIVIPLVYGTAAAAGMVEGATEPVLLASIAAILSGAVFGDHCSPISDTTIMSSMASGADHIDHVRTQLPYALTIGAASLAFGYILTALGAPAALSILAACAALFVTLLAFGRKSE